MCGFDTCVGYCLDLLQRIITFFLSCVLACSVCIILTVAIIVGLAFGYNYSMAEFLTFKRSDVTVYMRRGQFKDLPDLKFNDNYRRSGGENDAFSDNITSDFHEEKINDTDDMKPLDQNWAMGDDTRKYAEKITKYSESPYDDLQKQIDGTFKETSINNDPMPAMLPSRRITVGPSRTMFVTTWHREPSEMITTKSNDIEDFSQPDENIIKIPDYKLDLFKNHSKEFKVTNTQEIESVTPDIKIIVKSKPKKQSGYIPMHNWDTSTVVANSDYSNDEVDDYAIVYKPV